MKSPRALPYILAATLLLFLVVMVQTQKPLSLNTPAAISTELFRNIDSSDQCRSDSFAQGTLCFKMGSDCRPPTCWTGAKN